MKYLYAILAIICLATVPTLYFVWPESPTPPETVAVTVNGHDLTKDVVTSKGYNSGYHSGKYSEVLDSAIMRELLIQEAEVQNINREKAFLESLKNYYEETLIKTLLDRQYKTIQVAVNNEEVERYLSYHGKIVSFTHLPAGSVASSTATPDSGKHNEVLFEDLAIPLRILLASLDPGESALRFDTGSEQYAIRLDRVIAADNPNLPPTAGRETIREMLKQHKLQQQITSWLGALRDKASITIHSN